ncbi:MAG: uracil-DNA glycosylase [Synergistaceae bacterium]|nr:uracil-DNA glycosylase [Synergistaceae bacterium]
MSIDINSAWEELKNRVQNCQKCKLCEQRHNTVFGEGPVENCKVMIIGEGPGEEEDLSGRPFIGPAGQLLTKILEQGGGIPRSSVYIANIVKCRPPDNRNPEQEEMLACSEYIEAQLLLLRPKIVVAMGNISAQWLLKSKQGITKLRGQWLDWRGIKLFPMFHPSYLLRNASRAKGSPKDLTWQDIKALKLKIDEIN